MLTPERAISLACATSENVTSIVVVLLVSTTAALTPFSDSSRRYVLLLDTCAAPLPLGLAWSYSFVHVSPGLTGLLGSTAVTKKPPPRPDRACSAVPLGSWLPPRPTNRPSDPTWMSIVCALPPLLVLLWPSTVVLK